MDLIAVNDAPVVINPLNDFNVTVSEPFSRVLSNNTFNQPVSELSLLVKENGGDLTSLNFDATTRTLNDSLATAGENRFSFFASDRCNQTAASNFTINAFAAPVAPPIATPIAVPVSTPLTDSNTALSPIQDNTGPIVGGVVGGIAGLMVLGGAIFGGLWAWRKKQAEKPSDTAAKPAVVNTEKPAANAISTNGVNANAAEMVETSASSSKSKGTSEESAESSVSSPVASDHVEESAENSGSAYELDDNAEESAEHSASSSASRHTP